MEREVSNIAVVPRLHLVSQVNGGSQDPRAGEVVAELLDVLRNTRRRVHDVVGVVRRHTSFEEPGRELGADGAGAETGLINANGSKRTKVQLNVNTVFQCRGKEA